MVQWFEEGNARRESLLLCRGYLSLLPPFSLYHLLVAKGGAKTTARSVVGA